MSNLEIIRKVLETHRFDPQPRVSLQKCLGCPWIGWHHEEHLAEVIQDAIQPIIETIDQLRAIPWPTTESLSGALIKSNALVDPDNGEYGLGSLYELNTDGSWNDLDSRGERTAVSPEAVPLPAILIWTPEGTNP